MHYAVEGHTIVELRTRYAVLSKSAALSLKYVLIVHIWPENVYMVRRALTRGIRWYPS